MSYEFKMKGHGNGRKSRLYKKTKRASMNGVDASHLPMRVQSDKNGYWGQTSRGRGHIPYKKVENFLMKRVGRPVNDVFSEFVVEMKKYKQNKPIKETFDSFLDYEEEKMKDYQWASGFYVSNGILNYKKYSRKKQAYSPKHIKWNDTHIIDVFDQLHKATTIGPLFIGKLWVSVKGNYMLLPVWVVSSGKFSSSRDTEARRYSSYTKAQLEHLLQFTKVTVIGRGSYYEILTYASPLGRWYSSYTYYDYIVKITDIEEYTKQKFKES